MDHSPIYRSEARPSIRRSGLWRRPAALAGAAAAFALSGVALGYQGVQTTPSPEPPSGGSVEAPTFSVISGHPDVLSVISAALNQRFRVGPELVQALLPFGPPGPPVAPPGF